MTLLQRMLCGRMPGVALGSRARAQAARLADRLAPERLAAVYASPLERARETAEPIAEAAGVAVRTEPGAERDRLRRLERPDLGRARQRSGLGGLERRSGARSPARRGDARGAAGARGRLARGGARPPRRASGSPPLLMPSRSRAALRLGARGAARGARPARRSARRSISVVRGRATGAFGCDAINEVVR